MKTILIPTLLFTLLLQSCYQQQKVVELKPIKTIHLRADGEVKVEPDQASVVIYLSCLDKNIQKSKTCLLEKSAELNALLATYKIDSKDILTTRLSQNKQNKWKNGGYEFEGYAMSVSTHVTIRNLKVLEDLYTELLADENINLGSLQFTHSQHDSLGQLAYQNAVDQANLLADNLLAKMPETEKEIQRIGNVELTNTAIDFNKLEDKPFARANARKDKSIEINTGEISISRSIYVDYRLK